MDKLREFFKRDKFAELAGIELLEISPGKAKAKMKIGPQHLNGVDIVHGGAIFTLADLVFAAASNSHGTVAVAINASISFIKASSAGTTLFAEGREVACNPKLATYSIDVTNEAGEIIAVFQGMVYRKKDTLADVMSASSRK
jgi:acyl-CoA thioesterase